MSVDFFDFTKLTSAKKVSEKLRSALHDETFFNDLKQYLVDNDADFSRDLFVSFFEHNLAERKGAKQDYTPKEVADLMWDIQDTAGNKSVLDPTGGTGSLLINALNEDKQVSYTELDDEASEFAKLNALLRGKSADDFKVTDALQLTDKKYDLIIANPPYSIPYNPDDYDYTLFNQAGKKAPKAKADYAFLAMIIDKLNENGSASVLFPHGVLFRGNAEGALRKQLIKDNYLDAVIGLPSNLFFGTSIPTVLLILKKSRQRKDILFIDASEGFEKGKQVNVLGTEHAQKILDVYRNWREVDRFAHVVPLQEIEENEFNLNIPRYVDTFIPEDPIDLEENSRQIIETNREIQLLESELFNQSGELIDSHTGDRAFDEDILRKLSLLISLWETRGKLLLIRKKGLMQKMFV